MQTVKGAESDAQGRRRRKEGKRESQKPRIGDVESIRSQKQEGRTNREAAETQDHSAPSPVVRKSTVCCMMGLLKFLSTFSML